MAVERTFTIRFDADDLASEFCEMGAADQAQALDYIADFFSDWGTLRAERQALEVGARLTPKARELLKTMIESEPLKT